tara:strand:- start:1293 stop:1433 length:141 start_codon:yes stop_codon:yes gene_type:complete
MIKSKTHSLRGFARTNLIISSLANVVMVLAPFNFNVFSKLILPNAS